MLRLNLCSGPNLFPGWLNIDRADQTEYIRILREDVPPEMAAQWPEHQRRLVTHLRNGGKIDFRVGDARGALGFEENSVEAIYIGQAVEHFNRVHSLPGFLHECWTILKPGGRLRITTPDLDLLLEAYQRGTLDKFAKEQPEYYAKAAPADQLAFIMFGATGPECDQESYEGHFHIFTRGTIATALTEAGFKGPYEFGEKSAVFADAQDQGMTHSLGVEAVKR